MTYDYHGNSKGIFLTGFELEILGAWDNVTGMNAPLFGGDDEENRWNVVGEKIGRNYSKDIL